MCLHAHPLNDEREALGQPQVNSVWLSGCGVRQPTRPPAGLVVDDRLRRPALAEDWDAWRHAWQALDAGPLADLASRAGGAGGSLTLCGERGAVTHRVAPGTAWRRLAARLRGADPVALLENL
jgi:hypothetical protein